VGRERLADRPRRGRRVSGTFELVAAQGHGLHFRREDPEAITDLDPEIDRRRGSQRDRLVRSRDQSVEDDSTQ
jgi:hypothetical protein